MKYRLLSYYLFQRAQEYVNNHHMCQLSHGMKNNYGSKL